MRSICYRLLLALVAIAATCSVLRAAESELSFAVVGDWGKGNSEQKEVAGALGKAAEAIGARFIVSAGDNFYPRGVSSQSDPKWKTLFEDIYTAPSLNVPWRVVLGNHDHRGSVAAQIAYTNSSPRWRFPAPFYRRTEQIDRETTADFFFLDTTPLHDASRRLWTLWPFENEQYAWLEQELTASTATWKIVIGHHPVFSGGRHGNTSVLIERLKPLFDKHGVDAYISGHDHALEHIVINGVNYLTVGASAEVIKPRSIEGTRIALGNIGFMTVRLTHETMSIEFVDQTGAALYHADIRN